MKSTYIRLILVLLALSEIPVNGGPLCFSCSEIQLARNCDFTEQCLDHQVCRVQKIQTGSGQYVYTSGCANNETCNGGRQSTEEHLAHGKVTCTGCCMSEMCNNKGCGDPGPPARPQRGLYCFQCQHMADPSVCQQLTICEIDELCAVEEYVLGFFGHQFSSGCKRKELCDPLVVIGRDTERQERRVDLCNTCCNGDFCNKNCGKNATAVSNAAWTSWGPWSICPMNTCAHVNQRRKRRCIDQSTQNEVNTCPGPSMESRPCANVTCSDCQDIYDSGITSNGVYTITTHSGLSFDVYCDMHNGGWIVIQNRFDGHENFTRTWSEYKSGFGDLHSEFWLGLDKVYHLTNPIRRSVTYELQRTDGMWLNGTFSRFYIEPESSHYLLHISSYINGNLVGDSIIHDSGNYFHTYDVDNSFGCAHKHHGGWWYFDCTYLNMNGKYGLYNDESGMVLNYFGYKNLQATRMKIK